MSNAAELATWTTRGSAAGGHAGQRKDHEYVDPVRVSPAEAASGLIAPLWPLPVESIMVNDPGASFISQSAMSTGPVAAAACLAGCAVVKTAANATAPSNSRIDLLKVPMAPLLPLAEQYVTRDEPSHPAHAGGAT
jgi:hypothetical protein